VDAKALVTHKFDEHWPEALLRRRHDADEVAMEPALALLSKIRAEV
jgi:hypothetical protein